nr:hypothetical protein Iba_chr12cCG15180 [Ipomoea batatas]
MRQEVSTTKKGKCRPIQEDESSPKKRKKDTTSKQKVNAVPNSSDEESSDRDHHFKWDRKGNQRSPSPVKIIKPIRGRRHQGELVGCLTAAAGIVVAFSSGDQWRSQKSSPVGAAKD